MPPIAPTAHEFRSVISQLERVLLETYLPSTDSCREPILPNAEELELGRSRLLSELPQDGVGLEGVTHHLAASLLPAFADSSLSPHYYGFVTGGVTPAALLGDFLAAVADQNVQVHLPEETLATALENRALEMLLDLFRLPHDAWLGRAFTTGCTASNILGLLCAREALLREKLVLAGHGAADASLAELGFLGACVRARVAGVQVLAAAAHSSVAKAAAVVGIGRANVRDLGRAAAPWEFDMHQLERALDAGARGGVVSIVVVGYGEVNTGRFVSNLREIRGLVERCGSAWIHVDAAFGIFARVFSPDCADGMAHVAAWAADIDCADSIAGDGHKLLNVVGCPFVPPPPPPHERSLTPRSRTTVASSTRARASCCSATCATPRRTSPRRRRPRARSTRTSRTRAGSARFRCTRRWSRTARRATATSCGAWFRTRARSPASSTATPPSSCCHARPPPAPRTRPSSACSWSCCSAPGTRPRTRCCASASTAPAACTSAPPSGTASPLSAAPSGTGGSRRRRPGRPDGASSRRCCSRWGGGCCRQQVVRREGGRGRRRSTTNV